MTDTARPGAVTARQNEDLVLIRKIREGDVSALDRLVDRYLNQLMNFFRYLRAPEASVEDLVQETFERVIRKLDAYDEQKRFASWLLTVGRNLYFDQCRRENRRREQETGAANPGQLAIVLDGILHSAPTVRDEIRGGGAEISGDFTQREAIELSNVLNNPLAVELAVAEMYEVGPSLAEDARDASIRAALLGGSLVMIFMVAYYGLGGIVFVI